MSTLSPRLPSSPSEAGGLWPFLRGELRPRGKILTPFNVISGLIIATTAVILVIRFARGLGAVTNLDQNFPWGLWIGFDVVTGVAFAGGAYVLTFIVYILGVEKYHSITRATVLNGFLAYVFYAGALLIDLGRPWNVVNPIIGNDFGVSSVLFLVAWHFMLYMMAALLEFSPAVAEWVGARRARRILSACTVGAVIFGVTLSTLHQSGLGALFLMAKGKIHPLWYSEFIPMLFFVSSIPAGLSLVIFEGSISHRVFASQIPHRHHERHDSILLGLARICSGALFAYFFLQVITFIHGKGWQYIASGWGAWYLTELLGFVVLPMLLFWLAVSKEYLGLIRVAAVLTLVGIIINRLNISIIAYGYDAPHHYYPSWQEILVTLGVISVEIWVFRWIVNRMPVFRDPPEWAKEQEAH
jgi:Ni/Fe-hydrogenase subunit HybB-like protein